MTHITHLDPLTFGETQTCFGCGPHNQHGLRLKFRREGDEVVTDYKASKGQDGPPGILHGGLQATLCDEVAGWALVGLLDRMGFTTSMNIRYLRPVRLEKVVQARAKVASHQPGMATLKVRLVQEDKVCCMAKVSFVLPSVEAAEQTMQQPMEEGWKRLFTDEES